MNPAGFTGKRHTEETKEKIRLSRLGAKNPMFGKKHSEEWRNLMRTKPNPMLGRHHSEETKIKLRSIALTRKPHRHTEETKQKLRELRLGEKNPMWKGDKATPSSGRERARNRYDCPKDRERHHIDGNPLNNASENIAIVTRKEHMVIDGRLDRLNS